MWKWQSHGGEAVCGAWQSQVLGEAVCGDGSPMEVRLCMEIDGSKFCDGMWSKWPYSIRKFTIKSLCNIKKKKSPCQSLDTLPISSASF